MPRRAAYIRHLLGFTALRTPHPNTRNRPIVMIQPPLPQPEYEYVVGTRSSMDDLNTVTTTVVR